MKIRPVILSGGAGTRLWPVSRKSMPKQFLNLIGDVSLFQETCERLSPRLFASPCVIGNFDHRFIIAEQLRQIGVEGSDIILEPVGRNTAPAALTAALQVARQGEDGLILLLPSDHHIPDTAAFGAAVERGIEAARAGALVTFGIRPSSPHTGYGYIETLEGTSVLDVVRFVEKPSAERAQEFLDHGHFFWNAGIFLFSASAMICAFEALAPDMVACCRTALERAGRDLGFIRLEEVAYAACANISLDHAIMEKAGNIKCVPFDGAWSDLGSWAAIWEVLEKNEAGNCALGDVHFHNSGNCLAVSEGQLVSVLGVEGLVVVATKDVVMVASAREAEQVKHVVDHLRAQQRPEATTHDRVYRPWGWYEVLTRAERFQVKSLMVKPGEKLSLQSHRHRSEHWVVVAGTVEVTRGEEVFALGVNQSTYIAAGTRHRLGNPGSEPAYLVEVQSGSYLGEDDIVRFDDVYMRASSE